MPIKPTRLLVSLTLAASLAAALPARAEPSPITAALFHTEGEGFTPPARNQALQALLAQHPALTFFEACGVGDTAEISRQLKRDPKLATAFSPGGVTGLHLAGFSGNPAAVQMLLERGGEININAHARNKFRNTPLQFAMLTGQLATARLLLERGADPLARQSLGFTPLQEAALIGRRDLIDLLLAAGAEINSRADDGRNAVSEALRGKHPEIAEYLRSKGGRTPEITAKLDAPPVD